MNRTSDIGGNEYARTEFWRELSWRVGDTHANRICWLLTLYCWLFNIDICQFTHRMPNDWR
jgi:hypothetical protein